MNKHKQIIAKICATPQPKIANFKGLNYKQQSARMHTEPSPRQSDDNSDFYSYLEINSIQEVEEIEQDLQKNLSYSFYTHANYNREQEKQLSSEIKSKNFGKKENNLFINKKSNEYYLVNNRAPKRNKPQNSRQCQTTGQQTSTTISFDKSSFKKSMQNSQTPLKNQQKPQTCQKQIKFQGNINFSETKKGISRNINHSNINSNNYFQRKKQFLNAQVPVEKIYQLQLKSEIKKEGKNQQLNGKKQQANQTKTIQLFSQNKISKSQPKKDEKQYLKTPKFNFYHETQVKTQNGSKLVTGTNRKKPQNSKLKNWNPLFASLVQK